MNRHRFKEVLHAPATGAVELTMALTMFAFALPFLLNMRTDFERLTYRQLAALINSQVIWGVIFAGCALWRIFEACGASYGRRIATTATAMFVWCALFLSFLMGQPSSPGVPVFGAWVIIELWTLFRIRRMPERSPRMP